MEPADPLAPTHPRGRRTAWIVGGVGVIAVLVALFLLLDPFGEELTREEFLAQGDEICAEAHEAFTDLQAQVPGTAAKAADLTGQLVNIAEDERDEIDDLEGPDDLESEVDSYLSAREEGIDQLQRGLDAARDTDAGAYADAQAKVAAAQLTRQRVAQDIGFRECSRPLVDRDELARQAEAPTSDPTAPPTVANPPGFPSSGEN